VRRPAQGFRRLLALDLTLGARAFWALLGARSHRFRFALAASVILGLHGLALAPALWVGRAEDGPEGAALVTAAARSGAVFILPWTVASTMTAVTRMLFQRGDLDLLLSSPVRARDVVAARLLMQAFEAVASVGLLLLPFAHMSALLGRPHWLALYPALAAAGLFGAGLGFALALGLFHAVGPQRARVVSQIGATVVGASAVIAAQLVAMLPDAWREALYARLGADAGAGWTKILEIPERAALGDGVALALWLGAGALAFALACLGLGGPFVAAAMASAGAPAAANRGGAHGAFARGLGAAMRRKEHRLLWRDPWLLSQMLLQTLYTLPVGIILWRHGGVTGTAAVAFGPTLAVVAGQLSGALAWVALSAEDAPEFLATAPATRGQIERAKLAAIALPVALAMSPAWAALLWAAPRAGAAALLCALGASASGALLMLWRQAPARRGMVLRRHSQSKLVALGEHWLSLLWAAAAGMAALGSLACLAPIGLAALTLALVRPARRPARLGRRVPAQGLRAC